MKKMLLALILLAFLALPSFAQLYQVGQTVDDFTLNNSEGTPVSLYGLTNKIVMELFWQPG